MKVVKIKDYYYGVIEDNDDLNAMASYFISIYAVDDVQYSNPVSVRINYTDDMNRLVCDGGMVLLSEVDEFAVTFSICPTIISETRFRFLCGVNNINYKLLPGLTMDINRVINCSEFNKIQKELEEFIDEEAAHGE